ncbi:MULTISPECIES: transcriptional regulator [Frigoribacterium]|uniref:transcriptional regulator n=1 Tax=Frigoribacterium TaxID=96492 RepID=UPI00177C21B8|nr:MULTISPECIES: transcriptional regulator [Frigoribacterium]MBD8702846.1 transcriptional regulator [Frigoribacterium sp. CFBP 13712]MCJ0700620.1 transcriptional regulator [Frigoribacterium faeni]
MPALSQTARPTIVRSGPSGGLLGSVRPRPRLLLVLEAAGFVHVKKGFVGKRPRTSLKLTAEGRTAWAAHLATLREIAAG